LFLIQFFVAAKLKTSSSFRALEKTALILNLYLGLELGQPCYGTILIWTKKLGLYSLQPPNERADDWVLIIDESIAIGHERLLVIYGVRTSQIDFKRALTYHDLTPLFIKSSNKWTGDIINKEIKKIIEKWGRVKYIVADGGNAICKSIKLLSNTHVYDITHKIAWLLKNMYGKEDIFMTYTKKMAQMRFKAACSDVSHIIPPKQRVDSRFMNLDILSDWGLKALNCLESSKEGSKTFIWLYWLKGYQDLIRELAIINRIIAEIKTIFKTTGLSRRSIKKADMIFINLGQTQNARIKYFRKNIMEYLEGTLSKLPEEKTILCTSDIIESSFGKYKNYVNQNPMAGITDLSLCMATFTNQLDAGNVKQGLENTKMDDLKKWSKENIGETNISKRKGVMKINRV
jgi:hypothetical protein